jgi:hypothetical protein
MTAPLIRPFIVGRYLDGGQARFLPVSEAEMLRTAASYQTILRGLDIQPGRFLLICSMLEEAVQFSPLEQAAGGLGIKLANTDATSFEAARLEAAVRHFDIAVVVGLTGELVERLAELDHAPARLLAEKTVWARPGAYERLSGSTDIRLLHWLDLGPAVAVECHVGQGAHLDSREWSLSERNGEIRLTSLLPRLVPFTNYRVAAVKGRVERSPCACGLSWPRILPQ